MKKKFLVWLCRWSYRQVVDHPKKAPVGLPQHRDPDHKCEMYTPIKRNSSWRGDCQGDGHYLCKECVHFDKDQQEQ